MACKCKGQGHRAVGDSNGQYIAVGDYAGQYIEQSAPVIHGIGSRAIGNYFEESSRGPALRENVAMGDFLSLDMKPFIIAGGLYLLYRYLTKKGHV